LLLSLGGSADAAVSNGDLYTKFLILKETKIMAKIVLTQLICNETEDNTGPDEAQLRIWADGNYQSLRKSMNNGDAWNLNITLEFSQRVKIQLYDLDNPGFPLYDDHDRLGTVTINPSQASTPGNGTFTEDGADYEIEWIPG
jgi:hypothetical protein